MTTIRMPAVDGGAPRPAELPARDIHIEVCFACKKCRLAFVNAALLHAHRQRCDGAAARIVQAGHECKFCGVAARFTGVDALRQHCESEAHAKCIAESPLSHEMEDVVNQITLLAARAAQESVPAVSVGGGAGRAAVDGNANAFVAPHEPKRPRFLPPTDVALTSAGH